MKENDELDPVEVLRSVLRASRQSVSTNTDTLIEKAHTQEEFSRQFKTMLVKSDFGFDRTFGASAGTNNSGK
jgi:hypothetical protein